MEDEDGDEPRDTRRPSSELRSDGGEPRLVEELLAGKHRALARVITKIENREADYRDIVSALHQHTGHADVIGITGSPGAGKSTLVDKLAKAYRDEGLTVGVIAVDPSSPFSGGAVLGDRVRMASNVGDMDVFFRSMSARGSLGGLSTATGDAVKALDAFGKDKIIIETVGAGQNEVDVVKTADTVAVLVPPSSGDDIQMLKAGILEIGDVFVVNKADLAGADKTVSELKGMLDMRDREEDGWDPRVVETVATQREGLEELLDAFAAHGEWLDETGEREEKERQRYAEEIRMLLREDASALLEDEIERRGGMDHLVDRVLDRETDPYTVADEVVAPLEECFDGAHEPE
ncbi:methylmalonyl Co-A mutase-associated GTPase MeaB [Halospeciosus flavus]|uniref:Methylmalonyl Co-A mutase-associated GTPase MeaB n=1 Tax=Halospeciosus flavus TaxID=3032283 RepID=A0ABD5Z469_9EURY|nr:methylmalonyl Co-A mutase-associated GTPase MeaB [Halospeciosus flavus]